VEAAGWPARVLNADNVDQAKQDYIADWKQKEGITLDPTNVVKNPGMYNLAKLCLNSMWYVSFAQGHFKLLLTGVSNFKQLRSPQTITLGAHFRGKFPQRQDFSRTDYFNSP
jgi:hypothetical protein